jgi:hypothetical protein
MPNMHSRTTEEGSVKVRIVEHKSSSEDIGPGSDYWRRLVLDGQISTYLVGAQSLGHQPVDVLYDVVKRPAMRPLKATPEESRKYTKQGFLYANQRETDETPEEYRIRLLEDIAGNPDKYYQRGTVVRLEHEVIAAAKDTWNLARWIREVQLESREDPDAWPRNPDACQKFGQNCEFWSVCLGEASLTDNTRFRRVEHPHEELAAGKRRLPIVTNSSLKTFRSCPRKYYYRYELGVRSLAKSDALRFGTLFHAGLEVWWKTKNVDLACIAMQENESDPFELAKADVLLRGYDARWGKEPYEVVAVEAEFTAPLVNPTTGHASKTFELSGKIDAIVKAA